MSLNRAVGLFIYFTTATHALSLLLFGQRVAHTSSAPTDHSDDLCNDSSNMYQGSTLPRTLYPALQASCTSITTGKSSTNAGSPVTSLPAGPAGYSPASSGSELVKCHFSQETPRPSTLTLKTFIRSLPSSVLSPLFWWGGMPACI